MNDVSFVGEVKSYIPTKVPGYLKRIREQYKETDSTIYDILNSAKVYIREGVHTSDVYESFGHDICLFLPMDILKTISINEQENYTNIILGELRILTKPIRGEFIHSILLELENENDPDYQRAQSLD
ncbi:TIR domain-containing protein [Yersinia enterocolitica]|nr:TIR domain-containing protein [Yersinia enterocolitica]